MLQDVYLVFGQARPCRNLVAVLVFSVIDATIHVLCTVWQMGVWIVGQLRLSHVRMKAGAMYLGVVEHAVRLYMRYVIRVVPILICHFLTAAGWPLCGRSMVIGADP